MNSGRRRAMVCSHIEHVTGWEHETSALTKLCLDTYVLLRQIHLRVLILVDSINNVIVTHHSMPSWEVAICWKKCWVFCFILVWVLFVCLFLFATFFLMQSLLFSILECMNSVSQQLVCLTDPDSQFIVPLFQVDSSSQIQSSI